MKYTHIYIHCAEQNGKQNPFNKQHAQVIITNGRVG